ALSCFAAAAAWPGVAGGARAVSWEAVRRGEAGKDLNAVYFVDSKRGWAGGDDGVILRTEDGGRTWARQAIAAGDAVNDIYFRDKEDGYVLAGNRVLITDDGGHTWRESGKFLPSAFGGALPELYSVRFTSKKRGWIVGSVSRRDTVVDSLILSTTDGGQNWTRQRVASRDELIHLDFSGDKRGWIVGAGGSVMHTRDGGETWARQSTNTRATLYHVDFRNERDGWIVGERGTILRTVNGGETWTPSPSPVRSTLLSVEFVTDDDGWAVGRGGVILRSGDGGLTWVLQESRTKQHIYALYMDKKNGWAVGADGMILQYER
ncbi:MAG TPA: YCF48-related protein, partial [Pyrinomonadaceae bacterium]|nr:YCF48-related protein [Pyrinomonadaceae bacterium]